MNHRLSRKAVLALALALALQMPSLASACRIGWDQHLFKEPPPASALPGAQAIRVRFSNVDPAMKRWPTGAANPDGTASAYRLIGIARRLHQGRSGAESFPVYAIVTSCSAFHSMTFGKVSHVVEGEYYLIGRFASAGGGGGFHAGGRRMYGGGDLHGGWLF